MKTFTFRIIVDKFMMKVNPVEKRIDIQANSMIEARRELMRKYPKAYILSSTFSKMS